jgi:hypothetical protein
MPLNSLVCHHAVFFERDDLVDWRVRSRDKGSLFSSRFFEDGIREAQVFFDLLGDGEPRMERPWLSVGTVRVSAGAILNAVGVIV